MASEISTNGMEQLQPAGRETKPPELSQACLMNVIDHPAQLGVS